MRMTVRRWGPRLVLYLLAFVAFGVSRWVRRNFDNPTIEQIVYHVRFNEGLATAGGGVFLVTFAVEAFGVPALAALLVVMAEAALLPHLRKLIPGVRPAWWGRRGALALPFLAFVLGAHALMVQLSAPAYARSLIGQDYFSAHYVASAQVELRQGRSKNLVLIYVESLEDAYGDAKRFGRDLLGPLRTVEGTTFSGYETAPGAGWTMGGIVASQCGIPLKTMSVFDSLRASESARAFLPGATCLGDILEAAGYRNVFMGGARLGFAGKGQFFADHGHAERYGRSEWFKLGASVAEMNDWGLHDDALLARAKLKLKELHAGGRRFNLTLLTLDTHHPDGFYSSRCKREGASDFEGIVECTARQVADFVRFARDNGMLEDTRIVILGDHPAMPNPVYDKLQQAPLRTIYNTFIPAVDAAKATERLLPYDLFPTILQSIGLHPSGGRLGLGYAGFVGEGVVVRTGSDREALMFNVTNPSERYAELWRPGRSSR